MRLKENGFHVIYHDVFQANKQLRSHYLQAPKQKKNLIYITKFLVKVSMIFAYQNVSIFCKMQYVGKSETSFHIRLNNHRKDIEKPNAIEVWQYFNNLNHAFHKHQKFIVTEQLNNKKYINRGSKTKAERQRELLDKKTKNFTTFWFKSRTKLTPWHPILLPFTTVPALCILIIYMMLMSLGDVKQCKIDFRNHKDNIPLQNGHGFQTVQSIYIYIYILYIYNYLL